VSDARSPRTLVVSASIGSGHVAAGRAVAATLTARGVTVEHVDLLDYTSTPFRRLYRQSYFDLVRTAPDLVDWLGKRLDVSREAKTRQARVRARLTRLISYHLPRQLDAFRPDLIVHTHFLGAEILSTRKRSQGIPQVEVITDFLVHGLHLHPLMRRYYVAHEELAVHLRAVGVAADKVRVTGIPIDARFTDLPTRRAARDALALDPDRDVLLIMAGGMEAKVTAEMLRQLRSLPWPLTVVVVTGRSETLRHRLTEAVEGADGLVRFRVLGYTHEVPSWMAAADLLAGKPGGLTTSEALAAGLPFAVVQPYPLQEEANANFLVEGGAGMRIDPLTTFGYKVQRFLDSTDRRVAMARSARALGRPRAAADVADDLIGAGWLPGTP
jgi:processive 1,2-diacylglycerol beta-glucosyltransferase